MKRSSRRLLIVAAVFALCLGAVSLWALQLLRGGDLDVLEERLPKDTLGLVALRGGLDLWLEFRGDWESLPQEQASAWARSSEELLGFNAFDAEQAPEWGVGFSDPWGLVAVPGVNGPHRSVLLLLPVADEALLMARVRAIAEHHGKQLEPLEVQSRSGWKVGSRFAFVVDDGYWCGTLALAPGELPEDNLRRYLSSEQATLDQEPTFADLRKVLRGPWQLFGWLSPQLAALTPQLAPGFSELLPGVAERGVGVRAKLTRKRLTMRAVVANRDAATLGPLAVARPTGEALFWPGAALLRASVSVSPRELVRRLRTSKVWGQQLQGVEAAARVFLGVDPQRLMVEPLAGHLEGVVARDAAGLTHAAAYAALVDAAPLRGALEAALQEPRSQLQRLAGGPANSVWASAGTVAVGVEPERAVIVASPVPVAQIPEPQLRAGGGPARAPAAGEPLPGVSLLRLSYDHREALAMGEQPSVVSGLLRQLIRERSQRLPETLALEASVQGDRLHLALGVDAPQDGFLRLLQSWLSRRSRH